MNEREGGKERAERASEVEGQEGITAAGEDTGRLAHQSTQPIPQVQEDHQGEKRGEETLP